MHYFGTQALTLSIVNKAETTTKKHERRGSLKCKQQEQESKGEVSILSVSR